MFVAQVKAINKKLDHLLRHAPAAGDLELAEDTDFIADSQDSQGSIADHLDVRSQTVRAEADGRLSVGLLTPGQGMPGT